MGLSSIEQVQEQIGKSETILICMGKNPSGDAIGSSLGLFLTLRKLEKKVDIVSPTALLSKFSFLPSAELITHKIEGARDYVLSLDVKKEKLQQLRYEVRNDKLRIFITAKDCDINNRNIKLESSKFRYDLIITLSVPDLENLGRVYDENSEFFYDVPLINIDHNPSNEYFGKINFVDVSTSSSSEIIFTLISELGEKLFDEPIATSLLTGIISETDSFQNKNTTPKAFMTAASLIAHKANKQDIIRYLYRTKSISALKLMGKIMSNLKYNSQYKLGWSIVEEDLANTSPEDLGLSIKELANSSPEFDLMLLLYKNNVEINGIINFTKKMPIDNLAKSLMGNVKNDQVIFAYKEEGIELIEKEALKKIKMWADNIQ